MYALSPLTAIDYLVIGHLTRDLTPTGPRLGGAAAYAALTARALGLRVGIVTSWAADLPLGPLRDIPIASFPSDQSTTFENIATPQGRVQYVRAVAAPLDLFLIPEPWRRAPIVHLAPVADEVAPSLIRSFPEALLGITPQGWLRAWNAEGRVRPSEWPEAPFVLNRAGAAVLSCEDVDGDESRIEEFAASCHILAVTEGADGARIYWNGDVRRFRPPKMTEIDSVGAGDIFAAAFFFRLHATRDPWEAGRFATQLAALTVTRQGLESIPTAAEIQEITIEIF
jgi:sugar/nucleoside kinase (ribokinase family)